MSPATVRQLRQLAERAMSVTMLPGIPEELSRPVLELCALIVAEFPACDECSAATLAEVAALDVSNRWLVGGTADGSAVLVVMAGIKVPSLEALALAAWLVAIVGDRAAFEAILERVESC